MELERVEILLVYDYRKLHFIFQAILFKTRDAVAVQKTTLSFAKKILPIQNQQINNSCHREILSRYIQHTQHYAEFYVRRPGMKLTKFGIRMSTV